MKLRTLLEVGSIFATLGATACSGEAAGSGNLSVLVEAENPITDGLDPGSDVENIKDGWKVRYDKFIVTVGRVHVSLATDKNIQAQSRDAFVADLTTVPASGPELWVLPDLQTGRWEFNYSTPRTTQSATRHKSVSKPDSEQMTAERFTYLIIGSRTQEGGVSCPPPGLAEPGDVQTAGMNAANHPCYFNSTIAFNFGVNADTKFGPCELDGIPGFNIARPQPSEKSTIGTSSAARPSPPSRTCGNT